jgi:cytochrome b561
MKTENGTQLRIEHYDSTTIFLHRLSAALVVVLWTVGQSIGFFPRGAPRLTVRSLHIAVGAVLAIVLLLRLVWRQTRGIQLPPTDTGMLGRSATGMHHLLYALLVAIVMIGLGCVWIRGDTVFNWFTVPAFDPGNKALRHNAVELHAWVANLLLALAGIHAIAAVWHHWVLKDGAMRRMLPPWALRMSQRKANAAETVNA